MYAAMPSWQTNVKERFNNTKKTVETGFRDNLLEHYQQTELQLRTQIGEVMEATAEREEHLKKMDDTKRAVEREEAMKEQNQK